jgi:hypothetical protein
MSAWEEAIMHAQFLFVLGIGIVAVSFVYWLTKT